MQNHLFRLVVCGVGVVLIGVLGLANGGGQQALAGTAARQSVKIYLVALEGEDKTGRRIGCGDSLVGVSRAISPTKTPLRAAIQELLDTPSTSGADPVLRNFWRGRNLGISSIAVRNGTATIRLTGDVFVAGVCDQPRIEEQIEATARQFPAVKRVRVYMGKRTLRDAIS